MIVLDYYFINSRLNHCTIKLLASHPMEIELKSPNCHNCKAFFFKNIIYLFGILTNYNVAQFSNNNQFSFSVKL
jgi:hypothetical protein